MADLWRAYVADVLALAGADLSRALPLGGVTPGGGGTGEPPAELLARVARGDVARARAAHHRLRACCPSIVAALAEVVTPGMDMGEAAARYAVHHGPLDLRDALERLVARETSARIALEAVRAARGSQARRSLADPSREGYARLYAARQVALAEASGACVAGRSRLIAWGLVVIEGELARYQRGECEDRVA